MKFDQFKCWPSRRIHLFQGNDEVSYCGVAWRIACDPKGTIDWEEGSASHPYDDLNYCQSCRRKAMSMHGQKYVPLTEKYSHLKGK
jgi:hypothetical protein